MESAAIKQRLVVFYLVPDFTLLAFSSAIEALRLANAMLGYEAYAWRLASADGGKVSASCGVSIDTDNSVVSERQSLSRRERPFMAIVCAGQNVEQHNSKLTHAWLRECRQNGVVVASVCTGAHILARAGLLESRNCVIHWQNFPSFVEQFSSACAKTSLFETDGGIYTCAGGTASFDMMLHVIQSEFGPNVVAGVCERAIVDRKRSATDRQRLPFAQQEREHHPAVTRLIERMQETLSEPVPVDELMEGLGLTRRQIERHFRNEVHCSPARYYMKLRLERAQLLLKEMRTPIVEVAVSSGFLSASHFSKCFREVYGYSPHQVRKLSPKMPPVVGEVEMAVL